MGNYQKQATQFENDVAAAVWRETEDHTVVRCGYSGNSVMPLPDVFIRSYSEFWDTAIEMKRTSKNGREEIRLEKEDVTQLFKFCKRNPADTNAVLAFKFASREPCLISVPYYSDDSPDKVFERVGEQLEKKDGISYRETNDSTYTVEKPSLDNWNSARSGMDMTEAIIDILP